jgi:hypothetical protein
VLIVQELAEWHPLSGKNMKRRKITRRRRVRGGPQRDEEGEKSDLREDYSRRLSAFLGVAESPSVVLVEEGGYEIKIGIVCVGLEFGSREHAGALEHQVAEMHHLPGVFWGEGAICDGGGEFGEETVDFFGGDRGAGGGGEFAGEIGGAKATVRGVGMRVAEAVALRVSGEGAAASIGESKLATVFGRFGVFRSHAGRVSLCKYTCLVTGGYVLFRMAVVSVRTGSRAKVGNSNQRLVIRKRGRRSGKPKTHPCMNQPARMGHPGPPNQSPYCCFSGSIFIVSTIKTAGTITPKSKGCPKCPGIAE